MAQLIERALRMRIVLKAALLAMILLGLGDSPTLAHANDGPCDLSQMSLKECNELRNEPFRISSEAWDLFCSQRNDEVCRRIGLKDLFEACAREPSCKKSIHVVLEVVEDCLSQPQECTQSAIMRALKARDLVAVRGPTLTGTYDIVDGVNPKGSRYEGIVTITRQSGRGHRYCLKWTITNSEKEETGCGELKLDSRGTFSLSVDWGADFPVVYNVSKNGRYLTGTWNDGQAIENLERR